MEGFNAMGHPIPNNRKQTAYRLMAVLLTTPPR